MRYQLCAEDDLEPGQMRAADAGGVSVVVVRKPDGAFRALRNRCSHHGAPLAKGLFEARVDGDVAGDKALSEALVVRCPWHGYEFDVETGRCPADPDRVRVKVYETIVEDGKVYIER